MKLIWKRHLQNVDQFVASAYHGCDSIHCAKKCRTSMGKCAPYTDCMWRIESPCSCWTFAHNAMADHPATKKRNVKFEDNLYQ